MEWTSPIVSLGYLIGKTLNQCMQRGSLSYGPYPVILYRYSPQPLPLDNPTHVQEILESYLLFIWDVYCVCYYYIQHGGYFDNSYILNPKNSGTIISTFQPDLEANGKKGNGWQGRLCWDIKFLCSYEEIDINSSNNYLIIKKIK